MIWTCSNCGKTVEYSTEHLTLTGGMVVCPQCNHTDQALRIPSVPTPEKAPATDIPPIPASRPHPPSINMNTTPPPHRAKGTTPRTQPASRPTPPRHASKPAASPSAQPKAKAKKKQKGNSKFAEPHSTLGCLWRSIVVIIIFLIVYILLGFFASL